MAGDTGLATYGDNNSGGWRLISPASYRTIMKPADESFNRMMGILLATLLTAGVVGIWVAGRLVRPLLRLTEGAKTIAAGNYDTGVVSTTHDEICILANTFNQMADALEARAAERTQLSKRSPEPMPSWSRHPRPFRRMFTCFLSRRAFFWRTITSLTKESVWPGYASLVMRSTRWQAVFGGGKSPGAYFL
jgi:HAMP domain-containing protein